MANRAPLILSCVLALPILLAMASADAQWGGGMGGGGMRGFRGDRPNRAESATRESRNERPMVDAESYEQIDYRLSMLETDLKLTPGQGPAWRAFAESVRGYAGDLARERSRNQQLASQALAQPNGLQHISHAVDAAGNRMTALESIEAATKVLYQGLGPEQKMLADSRIPGFIAPQPSFVGRNAPSSSLPDLGSPSGAPR